MAANTSYQWTTRQIPEGFEPEQILGGALDVGLSRSDDERLFPVYIQLNGTVDEFVVDYNAAMERTPNFRQLTLDDIVLSPIVQQTFFSDDQGSFFEKDGSGNELSSFAQIDPSGDQIDLIVDGRFLRFMVEAYEDPDLRPAIDRIKWISVGLPFKEGSVSSSEQPAQITWDADEAPIGDAPEGLAITAIIDDGIPFGHQAFRNSLTDTRIAFAWDQDGISTSTSVPFGREMTKADLDGFLGQSDGGTDEDAFYRLTGQTDYSDLAPRNRLGFARTHGSHVGIEAAGYPDHAPRLDDSAHDPDGEVLVKDGARDAFDPKQNPIIAVQLPREATEDTSGNSLQPHLVNAIKYIFNRADALASELGVGRIPLVINFSFGFLAAPHDGTHPIEKLLDHLIALRNSGPSSSPTEIVIPAGNTREIQCHGRVEFGAAVAGETKSMDWTVLPDDQTISYGVLYLPHDVTERKASNPSRVKVSLATPDGVTSAFLPETTTLAQVLNDQDGKVIAAIWYKYRSAILPSGEAVFRGEFYFGAVQTYHEELGQPFAPPGDWAFSVEKVALPKDQNLEIFIQRDDSFPGFGSGGRQSFFSDPNYERFEITGLPVKIDSGAAFVKRDNTLNGIATGANTITVSALIAEPVVEVASYSGTGPAAGGSSNQFPNEEALVDKSKALPGTLTVGSRTSSWFRVSGTSMATPKITRQIARRMIDGTWP